MDVGTEGTQRMQTSMTQKPPTLAQVQDPECKMGSKTTRSNVYHPTSISDYDPESVSRESCLWGAWPSSPDLAALICESLISTRGENQALPEHVLPGVL